MYEYKITIDRWVDGDTVDVDIDLGFDIILKKQRVRLHGINAPESRTKDLEEKEKGLAAKEFL
jgi:micrococcal nuclease